MQQPAQDPLAEPLLAVLAPLQRELRRSDGSAVPGAELIALCELLRSGVATDAAALTALSRWLGLDRSAVQATNDWLTALESGAQQGRHYTQCHGVNCSVSGCEIIARHLEALLASRGVTGVHDRVHCLAQCDHGPTLRANGAYYLAREHRCETEARPWHKPEDERPVGEA